MTSFKVDMYHNVTTVADAAERGEPGMVEDLPFRPGSPAIFCRFGSEPRCAPHDKLALVHTVEVDAADSRGAAEQAFAIGNGAGPYADCEAYYAHKIRSLSVGDVVVVHTPRGADNYACESVGWAPVALADFKIVEG